MSGRIGLGAVVIVVGLLLLAANLGYVKPFSVWGLWPLLIIFPALKLLGGHWTFLEHDRRRRSLRLSVGLGYRLIGLWIAVGAGAQLLHNVNLVPWDWGDVAYWTLPLVLVGFGLVLLLRPREGLWRWSEKHKMSHPASGASATIGDIRFGARPWVFKSPMRVNLGAGDVDMDLTTAQFTPGDNYLYLHGWAGEFSLRVPDDIDVAVEARCGLGRLSVLGEVREGVSCELKVARPAAAGAATTRLFIGADLSLGDIRIR